MTRPQIFFLNFVQDKGLPKYGTTIVQFSSYSQYVKLEQGISFQKLTVKNNTLDTLPHCAPSTSIKQSDKVMLQRTTRHQRLKKKESQVPF